MVDMRIINVHFMLSPFSGAMECRSGAVCSSHLDRRKRRVRTITRN
jgi:hypothetical protein